MYGVSTYGCFLHTISTTKEGFVWKPRDSLSAHSKAKLQRNGNCESLLWGPCSQAQNPLCCSWQGAQQGAKPPAPHGRPKASRTSSKCKASRTSSKCKAELRARVVDDLADKHLPFSEHFFLLTLTECEIIILHLSQEHNAAMSQQDGGINIIQAPSDHLLTLAAEEHGHDY